MDYAEILPSDVETALDQRLRDYWTKNQTAVVVASVETLDGRPIDEYSLDLATKWKIGDRERKRGLLVLVAPNEREVRIEVSCGLEYVITDVVAGRIIRDDMIPAFRSGDLAGGTMNGVDALIEQLDAASIPDQLPAECRGAMEKAA